MSGRGRAAVVALLGCVSVALGGCGDAPPDRIAMMARAEWNEDPGSVAELGYHFQADVGWIDRVGTCAHIPKGLRVTLNDIEGTEIGDGGDCPFDALFDGGPFTRPDPVTVRLFDGDRALAQATFEGMFWGMQASLVSPASGQVHPADQVVASIPPGKATADLGTYAKWYWLDTAAGVPPFYATSSATASASGTISSTVPDLPGLAGRIALVFQYSLEDSATTTSCTGFEFCNLAASYALGPISLEVTRP